jgi:hypothetical protein
MFSSSAGNNNNSCFLVKQGRVARVPVESLFIWHTSPGTYVRTQLEMLYPISKQAGHKGEDIGGQSKLIGIIALKATT